MRLLVFLLVFANLLFYAFGAGYFGQPEGPDAHRVAQQLVPEKVKIIKEKEAPPVTPVAAPEPVPVPAEATIEGPAPVAAPESESVKEPEMPAKEIVMVCNQWTSLPPKDADRLAALIANRFPGFKSGRHQEVAEGNGWWVYIPPLPDKAEADKKAGQLRALGVTDYFIVQEPASRYAISLGIFSSEKGAQDRLAELKGKGVRSAKMGARPGNDDTVTLTASGPEVDRDALRAAAAGLLPKIKVQDCK